MCAIANRESIERRCGWFGGGSCDGFGLAITSPDTVNVRRILNSSLIHSCTAAAGWDVMQEAEDPCTCTYKA